LLSLQINTPESSSKLVSISKDASVKVYRGHDFYPLQTIKASSATPVWPSDAEILTLNSHQKLVISSWDRSLAFYNVRLAESDPERPDETNCLGLGGMLKIPAPWHAASALSSLPFHNGISNIKDQQLVFGDKTGQVQLLKRTPPTMGSTQTLDMKADIEQLHSHHTAAITQLLYITHVGLFSSSLDGTIGIFDAERGRIAATTGNLHNSAVRCMAYHQPLTLAVSGGAGRNALLWYPRGDPGRAVGELPGHVAGVLSICTGTSTGGSGTARGNTENLVTTLNGAGTVTVFDLRTLRPLHTLESAAEYPSHEDARPTALLFDQERQRIVTATKRPCAWSFGDKDIQSRDTKKREVHSFPLSTAAVAGGGREEHQGSTMSPAAVGNKKENDSEDTWRQAHSHLCLASLDMKKKEDPASAASGKCR
jgi:WD40 repeat protein